AMARAAADLAVHPIDLERRLVVIEVSVPARRRMAGRALARAEPQTVPRDRATRRLRAGVAVDARPRRRVPLRMACEAAHRLVSADVDGGLIAVVEAGLVARERVPAAEIEVASAMLVMARRALAAAHALARVEALVGGDPQPQCSVVVAGEALRVRELGRVV